MPPSVHDEGACLSSRMIVVCRICIAALHSSHAWSRLLLEAVGAVCSMRSFKLQENSKRPTPAKVSPAMPVKLCRLMCARHKLTLAGLHSHFHALMPYDRTA